MKHLFTLLVAVFLLNSSITAQDKPEILPDWFFNPSYHNSADYGIGISDPHLDSTEAVQQAILRAYMMNQILHGGNFNSLVTYGMGNETRENNRTNSLETILFSAIILHETPFAPKLKPQQVFETRYNEIMVLMKMPTEADSAQYTLKTELIKRTGFERADDKMPISLDEVEFLLSVNDKKVSYSHIQKLRLGYNYFSATGKPTGKYEMNAKRHLSYPVEEQACNNSKVLRSRTNSGIWLAYLVNMIDQIAIYSSFEDISTKDLTTSNVGNWQFEDKSKSMNNLFYTGKTFTQCTTNYQLEHLQISDKMLCIAFENPVRITDLSGISGSARELGRELKGYTMLGYDKIDDGLEKLAAYQLTEDYTLVTVNTKTQNLNSGIIKATHLAKFQLRTRTESDVKGLTNSNMGDDYSVVMRSNKTIGERETIKLANYFIMYNKLDNGLYNIQTIMIYK